jgi:hypothetical protein
LFFLLRLGVRAASNTAYSGVGPRFPGQLFTGLVKSMNHDFFLGHPTERLWYFTNSYNDKDTKWETG